MMQTCIDAPRREETWSDYWAHGALHSLATSIQGNYDGDIRGLWESVFAPLTHNDHVLDVCTGNGALPALLLDICAMDCPFVDGLDLADIHPEWPQALPPHLQQRLRLIGNTAIESASLPCGHYSLITSQFGLEYTELSISLPILAKLLRNNGTLCFIAHHAQSHLCAVARDEIRATDIATTPGGLLATSAAIIPWMALLSQRGPAAMTAEAAQLRSQFNQEMQSWAAHIQALAYPDTLVDARHRISELVQSTAQGQLSTTQALAHHAILLDQLEKARFRNHELLHHALDETKIQTLTAILDSNRLGITMQGPVHQQGYLIGWQIQARRLTD